MSQMSRGRREAPGHSGIQFRNLDHSRQCVGSRGFQLRVEASPFCALEQNTSPVGFVDNCPHPSVQALRAASVAGFSMVVCSNWAPLHGLHPLGKVQIGLPSAIETVPPKLAQMLGDKGLPGSNGKTWVAAGAGVTAGTLAGAPGAAPVAAKMSTAKIDPNIGPVPLKDETNRDCIGAARPCPASFA